MKRNHSIHLASFNSSSKAKPLECRINEQICAQAKWQATAMEKKAKRDGLQDFDTFARDVKAQFCEQQKLIDQRLEHQNVLLTEMAEFCKKRGEIEAQYAGALDKLLRRQRPYTANTAVSRTWHSLLESTRKMRDGHLLFANKFSNKMGEYLSEITSGFASLLKRYRELHSGLQQDEVGRLKFYREKLEAYRAAVDRLAEDRLRANKCSSKIGANLSPGEASGTKKERDLARALKAVDDSTQRVTSTRNEYLLAVTSENVALDRLLNTDFAFASFYMHWFFRKALAHAFRFALVGDTYSSQAKRCEDTLRSSIEELDSLDLPFPGTTDSLNAFDNATDVRTLVDQLRCSQSDYRNLLEQTPAFTPRSLAFEPHRDDAEKTVRTDNDSLVAALANVRSGCHEASNDARARIDKLVAEMRQLKKELALQMDKPLDEQLLANAANLPNGDGGMLAKSNSFESLLQLYNLNSPSMAIQTVARQAQETFSLSEGLLVKLREYFVYERQYSVVRAKLSYIEPVLRQFDTPEKAYATLKSSGQYARAGSWHYGEVFGMRLTDYAQMNHEPIPTVLRSCIRYLTDNSLHRPGIFRINGSLAEVLELRARFNSGENPLENNGNSIDVNSVASLLKLYLRELPEPLLPSTVAQSLVELRATYLNDELELRTKFNATLKANVPHSHYVVLRYLFAFLNHVTGYDENMMDAYNLAVCFGPTVTQPLNDPEGELQAASNDFAPSSSPSPASAPLSTVFESTQLVNKQRCINEIITDLIVHYGEMFDSENISGPLYSPSAINEGSFDDSSTRPHPSVSAASQDKAATILLRSTSLDQTTADSGKSGSVLSADSNSYNDADEDSRPFAGVTRRPLLHSESNASDSAFTQKYNSPSPLVGYSNSKIAQAIVTLQERASNSTLSMQTAVPDELPGNSHPIKTNSVAKTWQQAASVSVRRSGLRDHPSYDWPPQKHVDTASARPLYMTSSYSVSSEALSSQADSSSDASKHYSRIQIGSKSLLSAVNMLPEQLGAPPDPLRRPPPIPRKPVFIKK